MSDRNTLTRREFLRYAALGSAALWVGGPATSALAGTGVAFEPDVWLQMTAAPAATAVREGARTPVWSYRASVVKGDPASVVAMPESYLGPVLHVRRGQKLRVDFRNRIDDASIINWHGLHVPARMQGLPRYAAKPGASYRYEFTIDDRAGTYWYHAMSPGRTPQQVYFGLAGMLVVHDRREASLPLPRGACDLPIVVQDRDFGPDNRFSYPLGGGPALLRVRTSPGGPGSMPAA